MNTRIIGLSVAFALVFSGAGQSQLVGTTGAGLPVPHARALAGTVANREGTPLAGAEVAAIEHDSTIQRSVSDESGHFHLDQLPAGTIHLRVRHIGFETRNLAVDQAADGPAPALFVKLDPVVAVLDGMAVSATEPDSLSPQLREFYSRANASHFGFYIDEKRLNDLRPEFASDALRTVPGVVVRPARIGNDVRIRGCAPLVWIDGMRAKGAQVDEVTHGTDVAAIEVYESLAGVPAQYTDRSATCGTILIWTRTR